MLTYQDIAERNQALAVVMVLANRGTNITRAFRRFVDSSEIIRTSPNAVNEVRQIIECLGECLLVIRAADFGLKQANYRVTIEAFAASLVPIQTVFNNLEDVLRRKGIL